MKKILYIAFLAMLSACINNNDKADAYGNFEATEIVISAMGQGEILQLDIEEGDVVQQAARVGLIDTTDLHLKKQQLYRSIEAVKTGLNTIDAQLKVHLQQKKNLGVDKQRIENLYREGAATKKQLDDINGAIDLVEAQLAATQSQKQKIMAEVETLDAQLSQVNEAISKCEIVTTVSGTVLTKYAEKGEVVAAGKPLFKLADMTVMKLKVYVSGMQLPHIKIGQRVEVQIDDTKTKNRSLEGVVSWISSTAEFTPKTIQTKEERVNLVYAVKVRVMNDGSLKIGMPGEIYF
ncbi:MAG: HlyD family efflux transporter periplasmic adaptor subunit [Bacteroidales bacterium]|nr:HlyD family efflux transporter periplasmic adaptor subunit [Bacteroidales bacterium]